MGGKLNTRLTRKQHALLARIAAEGEVSGDLGNYLPMKLVELGLATRERRVSRFVHYYFKITDAGRAALSHQPESEGE